MNIDQSSLNPSSLLDLKAELHKKYESFRKSKLTQKFESPRHTTLKHKHEFVEEKKNTQNITKKVDKESEEEEITLKKSRLALEAKAKLYEKITSNSILIDDDENERYLVDFQRKVLYSSANENLKTEENVNSSQNSEENSSSCLPELNKKIHPEVTSLHSHEKVNENHTSDGPVHYQNVQFNEVRDHGTGYFAFSMDETKRKEQMNELNLLRQETEKQRLTAQKTQKKRKEMLQARLAKVCERRNIDKKVVQSYTATQEAEDSCKEQDVDLSSIPLPETVEPTEKKEPKIRPWDVGKTNLYPFVPEKSKIRSQNDWIKERRSERPSEFAPPSLYR